MIHAPTYEVTESEVLDEKEITHQGQKPKINPLLTERPSLKNPFPQYVSLQAQFEMREFLKPPTSSLF